MQDGLTVIGKNAKIPDRCRIGQHCIIESDVEIEPTTTTILESGSTLLMGNGKV
ncbi:MAG: hypothetical protein DWQ10_11635 [Calditrichaeota bacterium]|nr:MAG: hypothetical protein DWQ10_11635 [Calditrichota bacterium]